MVSGSSRKLMKHIDDIDQYRFKRQLVKEIRNKLMTFKLSDLTDQKVHELNESEWFI